jgi:hypothetical protein
MFEIDFLSVGDGARSGDAIAMRFTRPDGDGPLAHVIIDAGFKPSGEKLIDHVEQTYGVDTGRPSHPHSSRRRSHRRDGRASRRPPGECAGRP